MTESKRYNVICKKEPRGQVVTDNGIPCTARTCCTRLNRLEEEKGKLKKNLEFAELLANHRGEMICFANALIQDLDDEVSQKQWETFKDEMYKEWKQKRGIE